VAWSWASALVTRASKDPSDQRPFRDAPQHPGIHGGEPSRCVNSANDAEQRQFARANLDLSEDLPWI